MELLLRQGQLCLEVEDILWNVSERRFGIQKNFGMFRGGTKGREMDGLA